MGFRKSPRLAAEEVDEYLPSQDAPVYVAAAASSEKGKGRLMVGKRGPRVGWSRPHSTDVQAHRTPHEATSRGLAGHAVAYGSSQDFLFCLDRQSYEIHSRVACGVT